MEHLAVSRATVYRDLKVLEDGGLALERTTQNGEARVRLDEQALGSRAWTRDESIALALARATLAPLAGTKISKALAAIANGAPKAPGITVLENPAPTRKEVNAILERAVEEERAIRAVYRGSKDGAARERVLEPLHLIVRSGSVYVTAREPDTDAIKTFKAFRFERVELLGARGAGAGPKDRRVHRIWSGPAVELVVHMAPNVAHLAVEWPVAPNQTVEGTEGGGAIVRATVAEVEARPWVLSWGRGAEVLAPASLRAAVAAELEAALRPYGLSQAVETGKP